MPGTDRKLVCRTTVDPIPALTRVEELDVGPPEPVDGLLGIAHDEQRAGAGAPPRRSSRRRRRRAGRPVPPGSGRCPGIRRSSSRRYRCRSAATGSPPPRTSRRACTSRSWKVRRPSTRRCSAAASVKVARRATRSPRTARRTSSRRSRRACSASAQAARTSAIWPVQFSCRPWAQRKGGRVSSSWRTASYVRAGRRQESARTGERSAQVAGHVVPVVGAPAPCPPGTCQSIDDRAGVGRGPVTVARRHPAQVLERTVFEPVPVGVQGPRHGGQIGVAQPGREPKDESALGVGFVEKGVGIVVPALLEVSGVGRVVEHLEPRGETGIDAVLDQDALGEGVQGADGGVVDLGAGR